MIRQVRAHAKVNLALCVGNRRHDGFHDIASIMQLLSVHDLISLDIGAESLGSGPGHSEVEVVCEALANGDTLVKRTIESVARIAGVHITGTVSINKNIPVGAGLGGGSSDAGSVLNALIDLFEINLEFEQVMEVAAEIGSDVPFFASSNSTGYVTGRGEIVEGLDVDFTKQMSKVLLVWPGVEQNTASVYRRLSKPYGRNVAPMPSSMTMVEDVLEGRFRNDLEAPALAACAQLRSLVSHIRSCGQVCFVAGSGSTVVVVNPYEGLETELADHFGNTMPGLWLADATLIQSATNKLQQAKHV